MASLEELQQALVKADAAGNTEDARALATAIRNMRSPVNEMSGVERFTAGAGKAVADTGLGLRQLAGGVMDVVSPRRQNLSSLITGQKTPSRVDELRGEVDETRQRDAPLMDTGSGMAGNITGNIAMALLPGGALLQGGKLLTKIPGAARMAEALMTGGKAMIAPKTIPGAAATGAVQGAIQPSTSTQETLTNTGIGGAAGAAVPALVRAAQVGKAFIDPLSEAGQRQIVGRTLNQAAGTPETAALARSNIQAATQPFVGPVPEGEIARQMMGEIVPGSVPTTAQVAGVPSIAALSRSATAVDPQSMNSAAQHAAEQQAARLQQMRGVAGSEGGRDFAAANRQVVGNQMYERARQLGVDPAALTPEAQANIGSFMQRVPDDVLARAKDIAKINGINLDNSTSVQGMHWVKTAIDDKINSAVRAGDKELARAYTGLQQDLLSGLDQMSPAYQAARQEYAAMSRPINAMDTAQAVLDSSIPNKATGQITPAAFAKALSDKTAANATGRTGATLENTMAPRDLQKMQAVGEDLNRQLFADTAGKGGGSDTVQKLAFTNLMQQSGLPNWVQALGGRTGIGGLAQKTGQVIYRDANAEMSRKLAEALLNPQSAAQLMEAGMVNPQVQMLLEGTRRGGAALGVASPYLLNTTKE